MSTLNRMLFLEQRKKRQQNRILAAWAIGAILALATSHLAAFLIGDARGYIRGFENGNAMPKKVVMAPQPAQLISCDKSGLQEVIRICAARKRSVEVR